jgi:polysaccharide deacetylase 2 family uncharacterized protein YibQ
MAKNDLNQPLAGGPAPKAPEHRRSFIAPTLVAVALVVAVIAALWVAVVDDPDGGHPVAVASIEDPIPAATGSIPAAPRVEQPAAQPPAAALPQTAAPQAAVPQPPPSPPPASDEVQLAALPMLPPAISGDPSLFEQSGFGPLPRVSPDGRRPREIYARRAAPVPDGVPRVVIVVGGLGLSQTGTQNAIEALPEDVTLAFAPYGSSLERWVSKAREKGHEVVLQVPLEPMDYPNVNPGEHTLLVSGGAANRDDLHWVLGRMTAYAGVMNHMGGRFVQDERAMVPFLGEIGERGLFYLDDGTASGGLSAKIGEALRVPVVTADRTLDRVRTRNGIESELAELEAIARARGLAVGVASAFPASVEAIAAWARDAQSRGIIIIPASAAAAF